MLSHPTGDALSNTKLQAVDYIGMGVGGGSQHQFITFQNVDQAGVALDECRSELDNAVQHFMKSIRRSQAGADFVQYIYV
jgi:hypothetical protein